MCFILSFVTKTTLISIKRFHCLFGKQTPSELILKSPNNGYDLSNTNKYNVYVRAQIFFWLKNFQTSLNLLFISNHLPGSPMKKKQKIYRLRIFKPWRGNLNRIIYRTSFNQQTVYIKIEWCNISPCLVLRKCVCRVPKTIQLSLVKGNCPL